jgi:hypothetical protein
VREDVSESASYEYKHCIDEAMHIASVDYLNACVADTHYSLVLIRYALQPPPSAANQV